MPVPTRCCIQRCPQSEPTPDGSKHHNITVFRFPRNPNVCAAWVDAVPHSLSLRPESLGICAKHWPAGAKFKKIHNHHAHFAMRPDEPPSIFPAGLMKVPTVKPPERPKSPGPPVLERHPPSPQEPSTSTNLKGPYSLRKVKSKQYALMVKGFDLSDDEEEAEEEHRDKEEQKEEMEQYERKKNDRKKEKKEEKTEIVWENTPYHFKTDESRSNSISDDSGHKNFKKLRGDSSNSSCVEVIREKVVRPKPEKHSPETAEEKFASMPMKLDISASDSSADEQETEEPARSRLVNGGFTCRRCRAKFPHKQLYLAHRFRQVCARRQSRFGCGECRVPCGHEEALQRHTASHTSWGSSQLCLLCRKVVMWKDLFDHLRAHRFGRFGLADC